MCLLCICLLAMHTLICVTFSLPPGVGVWLRLLLVALPGLFCLPFFNDGPDIKLFILVGWGRSFFVCCLAHWGSTVGFLLLQCSSGVVRHPRDLQVSVATRFFCRVLIFVSSYIVFICDLFVSHDDPLMS